VTEHIVHLMAWARERRAIEIPTPLCCSEEIALVVGNQAPRGNFSVSDCCGEGAKDREIFRLARFEHRSAADTSNPQLEPPPKELVAMGQKAGDHLGGSE
jgi:hypothetical protein